MTQRGRKILLFLADGWLEGEIAREQGTSAVVIRREMVQVYNALDLHRRWRNPACAIYKAWVFGEIALPDLE